MFSPNNNTVPQFTSLSILKCEPHLWQKLKARAERNGLRPLISLDSTTYSFEDVNSETKLNPLEDQPLLVGNEVRLFLQTLRDVFELNGPVVIRRAEDTEGFKYSRQPQSMNNDLSPPDHSALTAQLTVESHHSKFMVFVDGVPGEFKNFRAAVSWVELVGN